MDNCGIYQIRNTLDGYVYIGQSSNLKKRLAIHRWALKKGIHYNSYLQRSYIKYGSENFVIEILELCSKEFLTSKEQYFLDLNILKYNIGTCVNAPRRGIKNSSEHCQRISQAHRNNQHMVGTKHSEETKNKMSNTHKEMGPNLKSLEAIKNSALKRKGIPLTEEHKKKLSDSHKGKTYEMLGRDKHYPSEETKHKISNTLKNKL